MTNAHWQEVERLFNEALVCPEETRAAFLNEACGDDARLRAELDRLLACDAQGEAFLAQPALEVAAQVLADDALQPTKDEPLLERQLGSYALTSRLGKGGMGEVFLARDARLGRQVAVKLLPAEFSADAERVQRFEREARLASALNHPNIITILEIGQTADCHYLVSEFVDGETLRQRLNRAPAQRLEVSVALQLASQIASALVVAHEAGIVHRDIKPENVMVRRDGLVKLLDFGLAKSTETAPVTQGAPPSLTDPGKVLGTVRYMSPEQARGLKVDGRSDLFSLGVLLYEMVAGQAPFTGATTSDVMAALLKNTPAPLVRHVLGVTAELEAVIFKCLAKDCAARYQTAAEVLAALTECQRHLTVGVPVWPRRLAWPARRLWVAAAVVGLLCILGVLAYRLVLPYPAEVKTLVVLPLKPLGGEAADDYLGLGIADTIITKLSRVQGLTVRPTSGVRKYLKQEVDVLTAAREQKADAILEGTLQRADEKLRIRVNLLRGRDGVSLWADQFTLPRAEIFALQDEIARQVVMRVRRGLSETERKSLNKHDTANPAAYDYYTKAMYQFGDRGVLPETQPKTDDAIELFEQAVRLDPEYALAHAQLGYAYAHKAIWHDNNPALIERAQAELTLAQQLEPQLAEVYVARAAILWSQYAGYQTDAAIHAIKQAQQIDPHVGHFELAGFYVHLGLDLWVKELELALEVDPTSEMIKGSFASYYLNLMQPDEALAAFQRFYGQRPNVRYLLEKQLLKEAQPLVEKGYAQNPQALLWQMYYATWLAFQGKTTEAEALVPGMLAKLKPDPGYHHYTHNLARLFAVNGKADEAMKWLRITVKEGFPCYPAFARDPYLARLRTAPQFAAFLAEQKEQWEQNRLRYQ